MSVVKSKVSNLNYKRIYEFYKIEFTDENSKDLIGTCPFCESENHFSVHKTEGTYRCFKCNATGNIFTFLTDLHVKFLEDTTQDHWKDLASKRSLSWVVLKKAGLAFDPNYDRWLFPFKDGSKFLNNLGVCYPFSTKLGFRVLKSPELPIKLWRPFNTSKLKGDVWAQEGEWDLLAAATAFRSDGVTSPPALVSTSGSTTWTPEMNKAVKGCDVVFFMNNDQGGRDGEKTITKKASGFNYSFISWEGYPTEVEGQELKDTRDLWKTRKIRGVEKVSDELFELATNTKSSSPGRVLVKDTEADDSGIDTDVDSIKEIDSYDEYSGLLGQDGMYLNKSMRQSLDITMGCALSVHLPDKPVWEFLVGPASTGKSVAIEGFGGDSDWFAYQSKISAESLVSGFKDGSGMDLSLLPTLDKKTLFIGDLTVILSQPPQVQEKLWGVLREAYMGYFKAPFGNQAPKVYKGFKFCIVAGVTHAIYSHNDSEMGERFIKIDYGGRDFDPRAHMKAAMDLQDTWKDVVAPNFKNTILGYYKHLQNNIDFTRPPTIPNEIKEHIMNLAILTTFLRTKVAKDRFEGMISRPVPESPARFGTTLNTMAKTLTWIRGKTEADDEIMPYLQKIAFDSCPGLGLETVLFTHRKKETKINEIVRELHIPKTRVHQIVTDFQSLGILERSQMNNGSGQRGRDVHLFKLTDTMEAAVSEVKPRRFKSKPTKKTR